MLTLLELFSLLLLAPLANYLTLTTAASTSPDPCRDARSLEPLITVGLIDGADGFCPTSPISSKQCCSANAWTTLFPQSWTRLANPFNTKLVSMEFGLKKGIEDINEMECPIGSPLQATTLSVLNQLATNKWVQLLNSTMSPECRLKIVQLVICPGVCEPNMPFQLPCRNMCLNTLRGCVRDLTRLSVPWKRAMNGIRSAIRILATTVKSECKNPAAVDPFLHLLSTWREPLQWLDSGCEELPIDNCYNGRDISSYTKNLAPLGSSSNPEFPFSEIPSGGTMKPEVQEFKILLESVTETLSHHWPRLPEETTSGSDQLLSDELGSGHGNGRRIFDTDDEDLLESSEFGSGSGDGEGEGGDFGRDFTSSGIDLLEESTDSSHKPQLPPPTEGPPPPVNPNPPPSSVSTIPSSSVVYIIGATVLSFLVTNHRTFVSS